MQHLILTMPVHAFIVIIIPPLSALTLDIPIFFPGHFANS